MTVSRDVPDYTLIAARWRTGSGRTARVIYAQLNEAMTDHDPLIGMMDTAALAKEAVRAHNVARRTP